ncbi:MAG TPA: hypothetical protein VHM20_03235, partial [Gammaproteobacteria bacterium]|nr:hypothetical protein [Gammaproteobacteria bacterium]
MANSGKKFTSKPEIEESKLEIEKKDSNYFELGDNELLNLNLIGGFYPDKTKSEEPFDPKYTDTFYPASTNISSDSSSSSEESKDKPTHTTPVEGSFVEIDDVSQLPQNIALGNYYPQKPKPLKKSLIADLTGEVDDDDLFKSPIEEEKKEVKRISEKKELSTGLEKLHDAPLPPIGKKERFFPGTVLGSRMYVGDKPGGMEPGVLLVKINYSLIQRLDKENVIDAAEFLKKWENKISNSDDACVDFLKEEMAKIHQHVDVRYLTEQTQRDANHKEITLQLAKFKKKVSTTPTFTQTFSPVKLEQDFPEDKAEEEISEDKDGEFTLVDKAEKTGTTDPITLKLAKLDHVIKTINKEARGGSIPLSLIKQYYNDTLYNRPSPPYYRMKNTHRGQKSSAMYVKIWKFSKAIKTSREHENKNAISEVFATAIARAHAMPAQNQYILVGSYETGKLMITTDADWETRFRPIEKNFAGQLNDKDYANNCYVQKDKPIVKVSFPIYQAALDTFQCAAQNLVLMLIQADDDGLGSQLQNKGRLTSGNVTEFYGIDFGHAYREENDLISDLTLDFTLSN